MLGWFSAEALGLAVKTVEGLRVSGELIGQELQGDEAAELGVLGLVNNAHPAAAELLDDAIVRDGLPDHRAEILGPGLGQVME